MTLTPHQTGELRVVGISYNLGVSQSSFGADNNGPKQSQGSLILVRGKQKLEVQGPRLNNTKEEKASKMYGPDRRLDLVIQQEMPLLQVSVLFVAMETYYEIVWLISSVSFLNL